MLLDNIFGDFDAFFKSSFWNRNGLYEAKGVKTYNTEKGSILVCNTLGIDKGDISVIYTEPKADTGITKNPQGPIGKLQIKGKTQVPYINQEYSVDYEIAVRNPNFTVQDVSFDSKDGLTFVFIKNPVVTPTSSEAKRIEDGDKFDW